MPSLAFEIEAYRLAQDICELQAKDVFRASRRREGAKQTWEYFYDPHAAHLLGEMIFRRMSGARRHTRPTPAPAARDAEAGEQ